MTNKVKALTSAVVGIVGIALLWVVLSGDDEKGIRVKNGSVYLETISGVGFATAGSDFESKKSAKACFTLTVATTKSCRDAVTTLDGVTRMTFTTVDGQTHEIRVGGRKFRTALSGSWKLDKNDTQVVNNNSILNLVRVTARGRGGATLTCELGGDKVRDYVELDGRTGGC